MTSIPCCIIDDHCDLIPFLHALWRTKKLNYSNLFFFHIDSHPDLVPPIPSSSADNICCNDLQNISILYDLLNTPGSISEFIIPLYINQHITNMIWLHPSSSQQFLNQKYQFYVGDIDNNRGIGVTLQESYYYDEGLVYDINDLTNIKPINFISCIDKEFIPYTCSTSIPSLSTLGEKKLTTWILDICLDYFTVCNPFRVDLEQMLVKELSTNKEQIAINYFTSPSDILNIIQQTILHLSFRRNHVDTCLYASRSNLESRRNEKVLFEILIKDLLSLPIIPSDTPLKSQFLEFFYCSCHEHLPQPVTSSQTHARTFLDMISALPHSIRLEILRLDIFLIATLPHNIASWDEIVLSIDRLKNILISSIETFDSYPSVISIARSDGDGYTDDTMVNQLQQAVLDMLQEIFPLKTIQVYDLQTDCLIKCRQLFLLDSSAKKRKLLESSGYNFS